MHATFEALRDKPCAMTIKTNVEMTIQKVQSSCCSGHCLSEIREGMHEFSTIMINEVGKSVAHVTGECLIRLASLPT